MNPRAAINDLLPFQGSPFGQLGYFSKSPYAIASHFFHKRFVLYRIVFRLSRTFFIYFHSQQRREWDSNPRALADKRFSRPPRYDHFDISPKRFNRHLFASHHQRELHSITILFVCQYKFTFFQKVFRQFFKSLCKAYFSTKKASAIARSSGVVILMFW